MNPRALQELEAHRRQSRFMMIVPSRRGLIPRYINTLSRALVPCHTCSTCNKRFGDTRTLAKHVALNHTGDRSVVCPMCDQRFHSRQNLLAHYPIHRQPDLAQVEPFRRRRGLSQPMTSRLSTGSLHGRQRGYLSEPSITSYGTNQTFSISNESSVYNKHSNKLPAIGIAHNNGTTKHTRESKMRDQSHLNVKHVDGRIPGLDAESLSLIDTVMGPSRATVTSGSSGFLRSAEERFVNSRIEEVSLTGWTVAKTPSGSRYTVSRGTR